MWTSIEQILKPGSLDEALELQKVPGASLLSGGSYLVAQKDRNITTLIDVRHLLADTAIYREGELVIGAGCTLETLANASPPVLSEIIRAACPSKNLRNQRTLGGEIAQARPDSDLLVFLHASDTYLYLNDSEHSIQLADWQGDGIITRIIIPENNTRLERVGVLDSAPAYVIIAVQQTTQLITLAIGGKAVRILTYTISVFPEEQQIRSLMDEVETIYKEDHFGSPAYKRRIVSNLLSEMTVTA